MAALALLGPQRLKPCLVWVLEELGIEGPLAAVTAGWQEREAEVEELREHVGVPVANLMLHQRAEEVFAADRKLAAAYRERQDRLRELQRLYRLRLGHALEAVRELMQRQGDPSLLDPEREAAIDAVRTLDQRQLERIRELHAEWDERLRPRERRSIARHRKEILALLKQVSALTIAGGHVAVLLNRLRLFGVLELAFPKPVIAWSGGAMVLAERLVLFHDSPPQGAGNAEVLEAGLGLAKGVLPLPHARRRLCLDDPLRVGIFARRFAPDLCVTLDDGARLYRTEGRWTAPAGTLRLAADGGLAELGAA